MKRFFQQHYPKYLALFITLILLGGGIFYYYAVNVEDNKNELNRKAFRTIDRTIANANEKLEAYKVNNRFVFRKVIKNNFKKQLFSQAVISQVLIPQMHIYQALLPQMHVYQALIPQMLISQALIVIISEKLEFSCVFWDKFKENADKRFAIDFANSLIPIFNNKLQSKGVKIDTFSQKRIDTIKETPDIFLFQDTVAFNSFTIYYTYQLEFEKFLEPLIHNDFLQEYIIFSFDPAKSKGKLTKLFSTFSNKIAISPLMESNGGEVRELIIKESSLNEFVISGIKYQAFLQPVGGKNNRYYIICGLMKAHDYQALAQDINLNFVLILIGLIIFAALLIPILNVVFRNAARPIHYTDLAIIVIAFMGITSLIALYLAGGYGFGVLESTDRKKDLKGLSNSIEYQFIKDFEAGLNVLQSFNNDPGNKRDEQNQKTDLSTHLNNHMNTRLLHFYVFRNINKIGHKKTKQPHQFQLYPFPLQLHPFPLQSYLIPLQSYPFPLRLHSVSFQFYSFPLQSCIFQLIVHPFRKQYYKDQFHSVFQINRVGEVVSLHTDSEEDYRGISLKKRPYFSIVEKGKGWNYKNFNNIYLQSVHGYSDGSSEAILVMKRKGSDGGVIATDHNFFSIKNTSLPYGKGFAVIDEQGQVLFHSDSSYNAYENFLKECDYNHHATSSVFSRHNEFFHAFYHKKNHLFYIHPIKNLPLFLVVFEDDDLFTAGHVEVITFVLSHFIILWTGVLFVFVVVLLMSRLKTQHNKSFILKKQSLFPDIQNSGYYSMIISGLTAVVLYQFFFLWVFPESLELNSPSRLVLTFISVFFGEIFMLYLLYIEAEVKRFRRLRLIFFLAGVGLLTVVIGNSLVSWSTDDSGHFRNAVFLLIGVMIFFMAMTYWVRLVFIKRKSQKQGADGIRDHAGLEPIEGKSEEQEPDRSNYLKKYKMILWLFATMASVNPTFLFFNLSYEQETQILSKFRELKILKSWMDLKGPNGKPSIRKEDSVIVFINHPAGSNGQAKDSTGVLHNKRKYFYVLPPFKILEKTKNISNPDYNTVKENYFNWLSKLRLPYNEYARTTTKLTSFHEGLDFWYWNQQLKILQFRSNYFSRGNLQILGATEDFRSRLNRHFKLKPLSFVLFLLIIWFFAWLLWKSIDRFIDKFTNFSPLLNKAIHRGYTGQIRKNIKENHFQVIVSPPGSGALELYLALKHEISKEGLEWIDIKEELNQTQDEKEFILENLPENKHILITNFSYDLYTAESNLFKLELLERLQTIPTLSITLLTHTYSLKYFILPEGKPALRHKWKLLHESFLKVYVPLSKSVMEENERKVENCKELLDNELDHGKSLNALIDEQKREQFLLRINLQCHNEKNDCIRNEFRCSDRLLYELQNRAGLYYQTLWESLTIDEQQLLFDLAEDGLVNIGNKLVIHELLMKGVLKLENKRLMIFNKSFHSYILSEVDKTPVLAYTLQASSSKWQHFKIPFIVSLIVLFFFIMISQNMEFKHIIPALTALATALPGLFNFSPSAAKASEKVVEKVFDS